MKIDIYKSAKLSNAYLFLPAGKEPIGNVPEATLLQVSDLLFFKTIDIDSNSPINGADPRQIITNIQNQGFDIQSSEIQFTTTEVQTGASEVGAAIGGGILGASLGFGLPGAIFGAIAGAFLALSARGDKNAPNT